MSRALDREKRAKRKIWFLTYNAMALDLRDQYPMLHKYQITFSENIRQAVRGIMWSIRQDSTSWRDALKKLNIG